MKIIKYLAFTFGILLSVSILTGFLEKGGSIDFVYPDGNVKALIMSYDDGTVDDIKLIRLFDENNIVGTFNLNSGFLGTTQVWPQKNGDTLVYKYLPEDSLTSVYKNHEIAAHSSTHKDFKNLKDEDILQEVETDIAALSKLTKRKIRSMAYPFGNSNQHIAKLISKTGLTNARTVGDTYTFNLPDTFLLWRPTCHDSKALGLLDKYLSLNNNTLSVFLVWGHSWEFKDEKRWKEISNFCKQIGHRKDIWYVGCGEFIDYQLALNALITKNNSIVNPKGNKEVWFKQDGILKVLKPGESIKVKMNQI